MLEWGKPRVKDKSGAIITLGLRACASVPLGLADANHPPLNAPGGAAHLRGDHSNMD